MLLAAVAAAFAAPAQLDAVDARLTGRLRAAIRREAADAPPAPPGAPPPDAGAQPPDALSVEIESADADATIDRLEAAGLSVEAAAGDRVQAFVPVDRLREVAALPGVRRVREPARAHAKGVVSEGYAATLAQDWHASGIDGRGVKIGILDVGFADWDAAAGEVPADADTDFSRGFSASSSHGTAVTEVVYDFAPGATYYLATIATEVELGEVLAAFTDEGVDVINASIGFDNTAHADGQSYVTRLVDAAVDAGAIYVAAAGNENDKYRVGALGWAADGAITIAGQESAVVHTAGGGGYVEVSFRWSEPFGAAAQDLDLVLYNEDGTECGRSDDPQDGTGDPYELVSASDCSATVTAVVVPGTDTVDPVGLDGYLYAPWSLDEADWTNTDDLTLPADSYGGIAVGAYNLEDDSLPWYSSRGPTDDGRTKPDVVGPTGVTTVTDGLGGFDGSSAAAPHVAGLAALWVAATHRHGEPEVFRQWVRLHARDLGAPGPDDEFGAGAAYGDDPPPCGCDATDPVPGLAEGALVVALLASRRRR